MMFYKYSLLSFIFVLGFLHAANAMQNGQQPNALIAAIGKDINYFQNADLGVGSTRKAEVTLDKTTYNLTAMKLSCFKDICFTFECSNKQVEDFIRAKLGIK